MQIKIWHLSTSTQNSTVIDESKSSLLLFVIVSTTFIPGKVSSEKRCQSEGPLRFMVLREIYLWRNPKWVSALLIKRLVNLHNDTSHMRDSTLIKKEINLFLSYIKKFRRDQLQSHIWGRAPNIWGNAQIFTIYEEAISHICLCNRSLLNVLIYEENFILVFISVLASSPRTAWPLSVFSRNKATAAQFWNGSLPGKNVFKIANL